MKERVFYIDMAKGIAMIAIVMLHICGNLQGESARLISFFNHSWDTRFFFFISGVVAALGGAQRGGTLSFFKRKTVALFLPYVIWTTIILPYVYNHSSIDSYPQILASAFLPPMGGYWFLLYLYVIHLMFGGIKYLSGKFSPIWSNRMYNEIIVSAILSIPLFLIFEYSIFFLLGYFLFGYGQSVLFNKNVQILSFIAYILMFTIFNDYQKLDFISQFSIAITASVAIIGITKKFQMTGIIKNALCNFGKNSLEIYLIHYYFVWVFRGFRLSVDNIHAIPLYIAVLGVAIFICCLCCLVASVLKKVPYLSFMLFGNRQ